MNLAELNKLDAHACADELQRCCGSRRWAEAMAKARPFASFDQACAQADAIWRGLEPKDWLEAFTHHPRIGEKALRDRWASQEQKGVSGADEATLQGLVEGNAAYEKRFGHIFLICATGKSAQEMLSALRARLKNDSQKELQVAVGEQEKITRIRLERLLNP